MKLRIERDALADAVLWASRSLPARPTSPILAGLKCEADSSGTLSLSAFDYEVSARLSCAAEVLEAGSALVLGRLLADICRSLPNKIVELTADDAKIGVSCGSSRFSLPAMPVEEYPELPEVPEPVGTIPGELFAEAVSQVATSASKDDTIPVLTGVRMECEPNTLTFMATDRYRLALREIMWHSNLTDSAVALVRGKTLLDAAKSLGGSSEDVTVSLSSSEGSRLIGFSSGTRHTTSLLLDGDYPKVRALFPASVPTHAVVHRGELLESVKRVALVADRNVSLRLSFEEGSVTLDAGQGDEAQASETMEARLDGEPISVAFNPDFLVDGLASMPSAFVRMSFTQPTKPAVITPQSEIDGSDFTEHRHLLMPVRFSN